MLGILFEINKTAGGSCKDTDSIEFDSLTGFYKQDMLQEMLTRLDIEENLPLSVIIGNINGISIMADVFGKDKSDNLVKMMAETLKQACRSNDVMIRFGGYGFIIFLSKINSVKADQICSRIKLLTSAIKLDSIEFSVSVGFETKSNMEESMNQLISKAEKHMNSTKEAESPAVKASIINAILRTLYEKSPSVRKHSSRVSEICTTIARRMNLDEKLINDIQIIGLVHDIGKIVIAVNILNKREKLTEDEWNEIKRHPEVGYRILSAANNMHAIEYSVLCHHERFDGAGYPNRISRYDIPLPSRILAVADAYDAMTSDRAYRKALSKEEAEKEIIKNSGTQFDPEIVQAFLEALKENELL